MAKTKKTKTKAKKEIAGKAITKESVIGEVIMRYPELNGVFLEHGVHCVSCSLNPYDSIETGAKEFGIKGKKLDAMIKELNLVAKKGASAGKKKANGKIIDITEKAVKKLKELAKAEGKEKYGLRVGMVSDGCQGFSYAMDFEEKERPGDNVMNIHGLKVFVSPRAGEWMCGTVIDFMETGKESGFTMVNARKRDGCGGGCGGCGGGCGH
ncbi:Iron-sulfur cluster insertion protein ErpA [Candidatus Gugararchaeum adminiculabundum]|nr:Iron-sulfur cluster insertion protein ErpA [Candidatus Gugararchaeum adminiculabundum]